MRPRSSISRRTCSAMSSALGSSPDERAAPEPSYTTQNQSGGDGFGPYTSVWPLPRSVCQWPWESGSWVAPRSPSCASLLIMFWGSIMLPILSFERLAVDLRSYSFKTAMAGRQKHPGLENNEQGAAVRDANHYTAHARPPVAAGLGAPGPRRAALPELHLMNQHQVAARCA